MVSEILRPKTSETAALSTDRHDVRYESHRFIFSDEDEGEPEISATLFPQVVRPDGTVDPRWQAMKVINNGEELPGIPIHGRTLLDMWCLDLIHAASERSKIDSGFDPTEIMKAALGIRYIK